MADANVTADTARRGSKIITQQLFYNWRGSLKPITNQMRWKRHWILWPLAYIGPFRPSWSNFSDFTEVLNCHMRRLGRGENGYLCLCPGTAEAGDKLVLARGGQVPLVLRQDSGSGYWRFIGEEYVHGVMDGEAWEPKKCKEFKIR